MNKLALKGSGSICPKGIFLDDKESLAKHARFNDAGNLGVDTTNPNGILHIDNCDYKLTLHDFRKKNVDRCINDFGHTKEDWSLTDWATALAGEVGEACNLIKKRRRGDSIKDKDIMDELADIFTYLDLLAWKVGYDLDSAVIKKFNEVSDRIGSEVKI